MKKTIAAALCLVLAAAVSFAAVKKEVKTVVFDTYLHCEDCVRKVQENISFEKGVKSLDVSLKEQRITVSYDASKTSEEKLEAAIRKLGYKASVRREKERR
ncbi:MAG: heavy-metal-associated domain-containing protein [Bacteroidales bacterium]|nr:heavy-metal-associated domain-containing protein [Bacteroidales bacterium]